MKKTKKNSQFKSEKNFKGKPKILVTSIVVDDREKKVIPYFEEYEGVRVNVGRVTTGDYAVVIKDHKKGKYKPVIIFERKSWKDFADSIKDGRMENKENLLELRDKLGCKIFFILEGQPFPAPTRKIRGIPFKNILKYVDGLQLVNGFQIIQTKDQKMTAKRIVDMAIAYDHYYDRILEEMSKTPETPENQNDQTNEVTGGAESDSDVIPAELTKIRVKTNDRILTEMWISLPQVSSATAKILSEKWTIADIICGKATQDEVAELRYPSGVRIGVERAKKILIISQELQPQKGKVTTLAQTIAYVKAQEKLLRSIHGVSAITAKQICKKYSLRQLCETVTEKQLAEVKRSEQSNARNVGPALAKKILDLLRTKNT